jgi:hypothetical protein
MSGLINEFIRRVDAVNPDKGLFNLDRRIIKIGEEAGEVFEAYLNTTSQRNGKGKTWADVLEELVDCAIVVADTGKTPVTTANRAFFVDTDRIDTVTVGANEITSGRIRAIFTLLTRVNDAYDWALEAEALPNNTGGAWRHFDTECENLFMHLLGMIRSLADEEEILAELDRKLLKWVTNMNKMPTNERENDV